MKSDDEWVNLAKGILRAEMTRRGITYDALAELLTRSGAAESAVNLRNKVARGGFTAAFFLKCLNAIGCTSIRLNDD